MCNCLSFDIQISSNAKCRKWCHLLAWLSTKFVSNSNSVSSIFFYSVLSHRYTAQSLFSCYPPVLSVQSLTYPVYLLSSILLHAHSTVLFCTQPISLFPFTLNYVALSLALIWYASDLACAISLLIVFFNSSYFIGMKRRPVLQTKQNNNWHIL